MVRLEVPATSVAGGPVLAVWRGLVGAFASFHVVSVKVPAVEPASEIHEEFRGSRAGEAMLRGLRAMA